MIARGRASNLRLSIAVLLICFLAGVAVSRPLFSAWRNSLGTKLPRETPRATATLSYETYLLLGVDDYSQPQPRVEAVWLAIVPSDYSTVDLVGLHPAQFGDQVWLARRGEPPPSIQPHMRGPLAGIVVLDRGDLVELANRLGGVSLMGSRIDGAGLLAYVDQADPGRADDLLIRQSAVLQSLIAQAAVAGVKIDLTGLIEIPSQCNIDKDKLFDLIRHYYPLSTESIRVRPVVDEVP